MSISKFPTKLPSPNNLDLAQAELIAQLQRLSTLSTARANQFMMAKNAPELAAVVRAVQKDAEEAAAGWGALSDTIRKSWGI
jgi:hypothetical protein